MDENDVSAWPPYGEREPQSHDIEAIAAYLQLAPLLGERTRKTFDRAQAVFEVYCEQFRKAENG